MKSMINIGEIYYDVLGKSSGKMLLIDPHHYVTKKVQILAKTDSGKTYLASKIGEELLKAHIPICILDPVGHYWGLKQKFKIIIFGSSKRKHADYHIFNDNKTIEAQAEVIADFLATNSVSAIIDFKGWLDYQKQKFVAAFAERIYLVNKIERHIFIEEADIFIPQQVMGNYPDLLRCRHHVDNIVRRGRSEGIGTTVISQRPALVDKNVLTQSDLAFYKHLGSKSDLKPARDEIEDDENFSKEQKTDIIARIKKLPREESFVYSPRWLGIAQFVKVGKKMTYHSGATRGEKDFKEEGITFVKVEIDDVVQTIKQITETRGQEAKVVVEQQKTEQELRNEISLLQNKLRVSESKRGPTTEELDTVYQKGVVAGEAKAERSLTPTIENVKKQYEKALDTANRQIIAMQGKINDIKKLTGGEQETAQIVPKPVIAIEHKAVEKSAIDKPIAPAVTKYFEKDSSTNDVKLRDGAMRMLKAAAMFYPKPITRNQMAALAGFSVSGGTFQTYLSELKRKEWLVESGEYLTVTEMGMNNAGEVQPLPTDSNVLIEMWASKFREGAAKMLRAIADEWPNTTSRDELARKIGMTYSGGTFQTYLSELRRNGLIEINGDVVKASDELFPSKAISQ